MITVVSSNFTSHHLIQLREWFGSVWGKFEDFEDSKLGIALPCPLLAISNGNLMGGLSFTAYQNPEKNEVALWINALFIEPDNRGLGIGSMLIKAAENKAITTEHTELFVYTNVPELYQKNGWSELVNNGENVVLKKVLI